MATAHLQEPEENGSSEFVSKSMGDDEETH